MYWRAAVWDNMCTTSQCSTAVLGVSYLSKACGKVSNAVVLPCSQSCPVGAYRNGTCSLTSDITCSPCAPLLPGRLLITACNATSDTRWVSCPAGSACYNGVVVAGCPSPRFPLLGVCACPNATYLSSTDVCVALRCADGWYPDASLNRCAPCSAFLTGAVTLPGVVGPSACACSPGYFMTASPFRCWLCSVTL